MFVNVLILQWICWLCSKYSKLAMFTQTVNVFFKNYQLTLTDNHIHIYRIFMFYGKFYPLQAKCAINRILPSDTTEPVVLFNNGGVAFLGRIKDTQEGPLSDKDEILFCDLMRMSSDLCVVCLLNQEVGAVFYYNGMMCKVCKSWRNFIELSDFKFANATFHNGIYFKNINNVVSNL